MFVFTVFFKHTDVSAYSELKDWPDSVKLIFPEIPQPYMEEMIALPMWQVDTLKIKKQRRSNQRLLDIRAAICVCELRQSSPELLHNELGREQCC